jgi:hypothetical protein
MNNAQLKFIFLKTPQKKHGFISHIKNNNYPVIRQEIYYANSVGFTYEFFGKSFNGVVNIDNFNLAIQQGFVSLVLET